MKGFGSSNLLSKLTSTALTNQSLGLKGTFVIDTWKFTDSLRDPNHPDFKEMQKDFCDQVSSSHSYTVNKLLADRHFELNLTGLI